MNEQIKKKWVKALRSGEYEQTKDALHLDGGYCCLGVLAAIATGAHGDGIYKTDVVSVFGGRLSVAYRNEIGLSEEDENQLISMNDEGCTFDQIAYCVEQL